MTRLWAGGEGVEAWGEGTHPPEPAGFVWRGVSHRICQVCNRWRVHTYWWEPERMIWREYLKVITDTGILCILYQDLVEVSWFLARIYD